MICVFACFILGFKSSILAGHTYLREPKLCDDLLELLSMLQLFFISYGISLVLHLYLFEHDDALILKKYTIMLHLDLFES